ncbi:MAG: 3-hydroxyacyl-CoA dehydrogenase [Woeseiaceae bacterium]
MTDAHQDIQSIKVACVGAGNVGRSWAIVFAKAGCLVTLYDISADSLARAKIAIKVSLDDLVANGLLDDATTTFARLFFTTDMAQAVADVDYVQESIVENVEAKREIFSALGQHTRSDTILASSTSAIAPSLFADAAAAPERCLVAHPLNPPHVIPVVELCPAEETTPFAMERAQHILASAGMEPVVLKREIDGFVLNRLQTAVMAEAFHLIGSGVCSPMDIETAMTKGLARRWAFIGPFMTGHLNASHGYREYYEALGPMFRRLAEDLDPQYPWTAESVAAVRDAMESQVPVDQVGEAQVKRDQRLMQLTEHLGKHNGDD